METGMGGHAVAAIKASCRSKYPLKKEKEVIVKESKEGNRKKEKMKAERNWEYNRRNNAEIACFNYIKKVSKNPRTLDIKTYLYDISIMPAANSMETTKILNGYRVANVNVSDSRGRYKATCYLGKNGNVIDFTTSNY